MHRQKIRDRLDSALSRQTLVRITRRNEEGTLDGYVVSVGKHWAVVNVVEDGGYFDGHKVFRTRDIVRVVKDRTVAAAVAPTQREWPPASPIDVSNASTAREVVLRLLASSSSLMGFELDGRADLMWVGTVVEVRKRKFRLWELSPDGSMAVEAATYDLRAIDSVTVGGRYFAALHLAAPRAVKPAEGEPTNDWEWFGVRSVFRFPGGLYEERIIAVRARHIDEAIRISETEGAQYADDTGVEQLDFSQAYKMFGPLEDRAEVYSLIRDSELDAEAYLDRFFDTGDERQQRKDA